MGERTLLNGSSNTVVLCADKYHSLIADLYDLHANINVTVSNSRSNGTTPSHDRKLAAQHRLASASLKAAILDLFWDPQRVSFYDYNLTASARGTFYSPAALWPYWNDIIPPEVLTSEVKAMQAFSALRMTLTRYNGTFPASFLVTGLQWDAPKCVVPPIFSFVGVDF